MYRPIDQAAAAAHSRWLAELAQTVEEALRLGRELGIPEVRCEEAREVYGRLEMVRIEIDELRRGRRALSRNEINPFWTRLFPSIGAPED